MRDDETVGLSYNENGWGIVTDFDFVIVGRLVEFCKARESTLLEDTLEGIDFDGLTLVNRGVFLLVCVNDGFLLSAGKCDPCGGGGGGMLLTGRCAKYIDGIFGDGVPLKLGIDDFRCNEGIDDFLFKVGIEDFRFNVGWEDFFCN